MGPSLVVALLRFDHPLIIGRIFPDEGRFAYDDAYLSSEKACPLSLSLPLREASYSLEEVRPYFEGLIPEGNARAELAATLAVRDDQWLDILLECGRECIGDMMLWREGTTSALFGETFYDPIDIAGISVLLSNAGSIASENLNQRLSLAGAQSKIGMAHDPSCPMDSGWFRPAGFAATTHILKSSTLYGMSENEFLCMKAAKACGIVAAEVALLDGFSPMLSISRFDRTVIQDQDAFHVERLHQEDLAQAFGVAPASKYAELDNGSIQRIAALIREESASPVADLKTFAQIVCFSYLIGNCDAHLKNYSLLHGLGSKLSSISLAPAYDLVCTTVYPRYSRRLAMRLGDAGVIDEVSTRSFERLSFDLGVSTSYLKSIASPIAQKALPALMEAAESVKGPSFASTPYIADDLVEDMKPRRDVLAEFCGLE